MYKLCKEQEEFIVDEEIPGEVQQEVTEEEKEEKVTSMAKREVSTKMQLKLIKEKDQNAKVVFVDRANHSFKDL